MASSQAYHRKIAVIGFRGVGKSSVTRRFVDRTFEEAYDPTIINSYRKTIKVDGTTFDLEVVDTAGQDELSRIPKEASLGVHGYVLTYAVNSRNSFEMLQTVNDTLLDAIGVDSVARVLVANKSDLKGVDREVPRGEGEVLASRWGCPYVETSAKLNEQVDDVFVRLIRVIEKDSGLLKSKPPSKGFCAIL